MRKRKRSDREGDSEMEINLTPMIDIVFQLLIFFVVTAKFIKFEGELLSYLPKDRGTNPSEAEDLVEPLTIFLQWHGDPKTGTCVAIHVKDRQRNHFTTIDPKDRGVWETNARVTYPHPDFREIRTLIQNRKAEVESTGSTKFPLTINFDDQVPVQMVVNMLDICQQLKITDFAINAEGVEIN